MTDSVYRVIAQLAHVWGGRVVVLDDANVVAWQVGDMLGNASRLGANFCEGVDETDLEAVERALVTARGGVPSEVEYRREETGRSVTTLFVDPTVGLVAVTRPWGPGVGNPAFRAAVQEAMDRGAPAYAVVVIDLVDLRNVSGAFGHSRVRDLVSGACDRIRELLGPADAVWPIGRKELGILLVDCDEPRARRVGATVSGALAGGVRAAGHFLRLRTEVGIATARVRYRHAEELIAAAESALNRVQDKKSEGPAMYQTGVGAEMRRQLQLTAGLTSAIARGEMRLVYQPIIDLARRAVSGFEVLSRWTHGQLGPISPAEFVPLAEQMDLQGELDDWVLRTACAEVRSWAGAPVLSVNISGRQADDPKLVGKVNAHLRHTKFAPQQLRLEVTETAVVRSPEECRAVVSGLQDGGVRVAMDDFGTGYASFRQLAELSVDVLKIDRSFIMRIEEDERQRQIVHAVITMSHKLGMKVVAEGVETVGQLALLVEMGCDYAQGYYFAKPLPAPEARAMSGQAVTW